MTDRTSPENLHNVPLDILRLVDKAGSQPLSEDEVRALSRYATMNAGSADPVLLQYIQSIVSTVPAANDPTAVGLTPSAAPSVADQVAAAQAPTTGNGSPFDALGALMQGGDQTLYDMGFAGGFGFGTPPGEEPPMSSPIGAAAASRVAPTYVPGAGDLRSQIAGGATSGSGGSPNGLGDVQTTVTADPMSITDPSAPDPGGRRDRRRERGGEDWTQQLGNMTDPTRPGSAFDTVGFDMMDDVYANPDVAANLYAQSRGGGETYAAGIQPTLQAGTGLAELGVFDKRQKDLVGSPHSPGYALSTAEDWLNQMDEFGAQPDARAIYRQMFKRVGKTDTGLMDTGATGHEAGDMANQIEVTNGALMAGQQFMTPTQREGLTIRLNRAAQRYMTGVVSGDPAVIDMTYPEYLRSVEHAQRWLGR